MPLYVQVDGTLVTGTLSSASPPDLSRAPKTRRFVRFDDDADPPAPLSVVAFTGAEPIVEAVDATFEPPPPPVFKPSLDDRLDEILTEVKKPRDGGVDAIK